ncbi:hypothetical protein ACFUC1_08955 [Pedococcus sp. NPDC057267]|uniref:hypothetical protein n=1 Tax=Pedococcus sp. NPDC057267 TaxID=3346077 RepID=UPI0036360E8C
MRGTVTITSVYCNAKGGCERHGSFTAAGTQRTTDRVELVGVNGSVGRRVVVYQEGTDSTRVYGTGWRALTEAGLDVLLGLVGLAVAADIALPRLPRRRAGRSGSRGRHARY